MRLFFLHVKKCGGLTLTAFLDQMFDEEDICDCHRLGNDDLPFDPSVLESQLAEVRSYKFVRGHYPFPVFEMIREDHFALTMLRSPLSQVVSMYNHWLLVSKDVRPHKDKQIESLKKCIAELSMDEFLQCDHPLVRSLFDNEQTRLLGGLPFSDESKSLLLDQALKNLEKFDLVTIFERYDDSLELICSRCGFIPPKKIQIMNASQRVAVLDELPASTLQILREMTQYDEVLYSRAQEIFNQQYSKIGLKPYKHTKSKSTKNFRATMDQSLRGNGWHAREGTAETEFLRWTGPALESTVHIHLTQGHNYQLRLGVHEGMNSRIINDSMVNVNGVDQPLVVETETVNGIQQIVLTAEIAADLITRKGETVFKIVVPETVSHSDLDPLVLDKRQKACWYARLK